jgi:hypothetical protein
VSAGRGSVRTFAGRGGVFGRRNDGSASDAAGALGAGEGCAVVGGGETARGGSGARRTGVASRGVRSKVGSGAAVLEGGRLAARSAAPFIVALFEAGDRVRRTGTPVFGAAGSGVAGVCATVALRVGIRRRTGGTGAGPSDAPSPAVASDGLRRRGGFGRSGSSMRRV